MRNLWKTGAVLLVSVLFLSACELPFLANAVKKDPTGTLDTAWASMLDHTSAEYVGNLNIKVESDGVEQVSAELRMDAGYNSSDKANLQSEQTFDLDVSAQGVTVKLSDLILRTIGSKLYFSIGALDIPFADLADVGLEELIGQWYLIDSESPSVQEFVESIAASSGVTGLDPAAMEESQITDAQQDKLNTIISDANIFSSVSYDRSDEIDGAKVDVLKVEGIDAEGLWKLFMDLGDFVANETPDLGQDAEELQAALDSAEESKADFVKAMESVKVNMEIWVDRDGKNIRKLSGSTTLEDLEGGAQVLKLNGELMINNINGTVAIVAPAASEDFIEYITPLVGPYLESAMSGLNTSGIMSDLDKAGALDTSALDLDGESLTDEELQALIDQAREGGL